MNLADVISELTSERERIRAEAERRMNALTEAIIVLENQSPAQEAKSPAQEVPAVEQLKPVSGPSVPEVILKAASSMGGIILDAANLKARAIELFPDHADKIKRGIYVAIPTLIKRGELIRVPGGYKFQENQNA